MAHKNFIPPTPVTLPANAVVGLWFGSNAASLTLAGDTNGCVNGLGGSVFGQVAYCNGPAAFAAAEKAVNAGRLRMPAPGTASKAAGQACPAGTRDFRIVDMDQSDNVVTTYLLINGTVLAQNTKANAAANPKAEELSNGSDNALINDFVQPIMGCISPTAPSITAPRGSTAALILNELQSQFHPANPPALVPLNDPMCTVNGAPSLQKVNLYRAGMGQAAAASNTAADGTAYCKNYASSGIFIAQNQKLFTGGTSPAAGTANNLFTFMANRFAASFGPAPALGCETIFGLKDSPVAQQSDANGVVTAATINTAILQSILSGKIARLLPLPRPPSQQQLVLKLPEPLPLLLLLPLQPLQELFPEPTVASEAGLAVASAVASDRLRSSLLCSSPALFTNQSDQIWELYLICLLFT